MLHISCKENLIGSCYSFKCKEAFVQCAFEGVLFDCCDVKYATAVLTDLGQCFQFDLQKLIKEFSVSYHFGSVHGLALYNFFGVFVSAVILCG